MTSGHFQEFEDEYLEMMYQFYEKDPESRVRTGDLAQALRVTPASTTEMVQRLAQKGYLEYVPYKGSSLTEQDLIQISCQIEIASFSILLGKHAHMSLSFFFTVIFVKAKLLL